METTRERRNPMLQFIRRTRGLFLVVTAIAVVTALLPFTAGPAHAATVLPANESDGFIPGI